MNHFDYRNRGGSDTVSANANINNTSATKLTAFQAGEAPFAFWDDLKKIKGA